MSARVKAIGPADVYEVVDEEEPFGISMLFRHHVCRFTDDTYLCDCWRGRNGQMCDCVNAVKAKLAEAFRPDPTKPPRRHLRPIRGGSA